MVAASTLFHSFPHEIVLEIFEVASKDDISAALALARVASWTRPIAEAEIYHTVVLTTLQAALKFHMTVEARPPQFFARYVRRLWLASTEDYNDQINRFVSPEKITAILAVCTHVVDFMIDRAYIPGLEDIDAACRPTSVLMVAASLLFIPITPSRILENVTHLYFINGHIHPQAVDGIMNLPHLTHLAVSYSVEIEPTNILGVATQLLQSKKLQRILLLPWRLAPSWSVFAPRRLDGDVARELAKLSDRVMVVSEMIELNKQFEAWRDCGMDVDCLWRWYHKDHSPVQLSAPVG